MTGDIASIEARKSISISISIPFHSILMASRPAESAEQPTEPAESAFPNLDPTNAVTELDSLCLRCHAQGKTKLLLVTIPYFREVVVCSFECSTCHWRNADVQTGADIAERGCRNELRVVAPHDLNRQVITSEWASVHVPELELEIPPQAERGTLSTVEGLLGRVADGLMQLQEERRAVDSDTAAKIDVFVSRLHRYTRGEDLPWTLIVDDPSGNSFVQNPRAPEEDTNLQVSHYVRSQTQDASLGLVKEEDKKGTSSRILGGSGGSLDVLSQYIDPKKEVLTFPTTCHICKETTETRMFVTNIPHFKEVVLMAMTCDSCGARNTEVKAGGAIASKARRITLKVTTPGDLNRDLLKSETACIRIPELHLELLSGTLGGMFTTVEGLLTQVKEQLTRGNPFLVGDSADSEEKQKFTAFLDTLDRYCNGETLPFTIIIDDPVANSFLQNIHAPDPDPHMIIEDYARSREQDDDLGLLDMHVEE